MFKLFEKKNFGIPVKLMVLISYFIGYFITNNLSGLFVAAFVSAIVFLFDFDDKVKIAILQSYVLGFIFALLYSIFTIPEYLVNLMIPIGFMASSEITMIQLIVIAGLNILSVIIFATYIIAALIGKDLKLKLLLNLFEDKPDQGIPEDKEEKITENNDSTEQKITTEIDIGEKDNNLNRTGKLKLQKQYAKTSKLFPPSQPQYPPMPQVKPPAKSAQSSTHKTIMENILQQEPEKQQNTSVTEQKPKEP